MKVCHYKQSLKLRHIKPQHSLWWLNPSQPKINQATQLKILDLRLFFGSGQSMTCLCGRTEATVKNKQYVFRFLPPFLWKLWLQVNLTLNTKNKQNFIKLVWQMIISYHKFGKYVVLLKGRDKGKPITACNYVELNDPKPSLYASASF